MVNNIDDIVSEEELQELGAIRQGTSGVGPMYHLNGTCYVVNKIDRQVWYAFEQEKPFEDNIYENRN